MTIWWLMTWHLWHVMSQRSLRCCVEGVQWSQTDILCSQSSAARWLNLCHGLSQKNRNLCEVYTSDKTKTCQNPTRKESKTKLNLFTARFPSRALVDLISSTIVCFDGWIVWREIGDITILCLSQHPMPPFFLSFPFWIQATCDWLYMNVFTQKQTKNTKALEARGGWVEIISRKNKILTA